MRGLRLAGPFLRPAPAFAFLAAVVAAGCATGGLKEYVLAPSSGGETAAAHHGSGVQAVARYMDRQATESYARERGFDLLAARLGEMRVAAFVLTVENRGTEGAMFDPRGVRLSSGGRETYSPLEYTHLYMALSGDEARRDALGDLSRLLFEGVTDIPPGRAAEGMVLFRRPDKFGRAGILLVGGIYVKGVPVELALGFKAEPVK